MVGLEIRDWVAIYGAVAATIAIVMRVIDHLSKRGNLHLEASINRVRDTTEDPWETSLVLVLTNVGQVPVLVRRIGLEIRDYASYLRIDEVLEPGHFFRCRQGIEHQGYPPSHRRKAWVEDGRRKKWKVRNWWLLWKRRSESTIALDYPDEEEDDAPVPNVWLDKDGLGKKAFTGD